MNNSDIRTNIQCLRVELDISLDYLDQAILRILNSRPSHYFRLREIQYILKYEGIVAPNCKILKRLEFFYITALIGKEKRGRFYSYCAL